MNKQNLAFAILVSIFAGLGSYVGNLSPKTNPPLQLLASQAQNNEGNVSVSTGLIASDTGGLYIFDHDTGELQCWMLDQKSGERVGKFNADVFKDMLFDKVGNTKFLMQVSYLLPSNGTRVQTRAGASSCIITEAVSGKIIAYQVAYDKRARTSKRQQKGPLKVVWKENFRSASAK